MKRLIFIVLLILFISLAVSAQTSETVSELTPVPSNIGRFSKNPPTYKSWLGGTYKIIFDVKTEPVNLSGGRKGIAVTVQIPKKELVFENRGGEETSKIKIYGRITSKDGATDGFFEEDMDTKASVEEFANGLDKNPAVLRKVFELPAGKYQIGVIVRDLITGSRGVKVVEF